MNNLQIREKLNITDEMVGILAKNLSDNDNHSRTSEEYWLDAERQLVFTDFVLKESVERNYKDILKYLLENGKDVNTEFEMGNTPIFYSNKLDTFLLLCKYGADLNVKNKMKNNVFYHFLSQNKTCLEVIIKYLIDSKTFDVNVINNGRNETAIHFLKNIKSISLIKDIISETKDINKRNNKGETPLMVSISNDYYENEWEIVNLLLESGADPNIKDNKDESVLNKIQNKDYYRLFLKYGADPYIKDEFGNNVDLISDYKNGKYLFFDKSTQQILCKNKNLDVKLFAKLGLLPLEVNNVELRESLNITDEMVSNLSKELSEKDNYSKTSEEYWIKAEQLLIYGDTNKEEPFLLDELLKFDFKNSTESDLVELNNKVSKLNDEDLSAFVISVLDSMDFKTDDETLEKCRRFFNMNRKYMKQLTTILKSCGDGGLSWTCS